MKQYLSFEDNAMRSLFVNTLKNSGFTFTDMSYSEASENKTRTYKLAFRRL